MKYTAYLDINLTKEGLRHPTFRAPRPTPVFIARGRPGAQPAKLGGKIERTAETGGRLRARFGKPARLDEVGLLSPDPLESGLQCQRVVGAQGIQVGIGRRHADKLGGGVKGNEAWPN